MLQIILSKRKKIFLFCWKDSLKVTFLSSNLIGPFTSFVTVFIILLWYSCVCMYVLSSVRIFATPLDCSLPGSSVHRIFQAWILGRVAISFSRGSFWPRDWTLIPCISCLGRWTLYHCTTGKPKLTAIFLVSGFLFWDSFVFLWVLLLMSPPPKKALINTLIYIRNTCSNFLKITQWHYLTLRVLVFSLQNINNNFLRLLGWLNERCFRFSSQRSLNVLI